MHGFRTLLLLLIAFHSGTGRIFAQSVDEEAGHHVLTREQIASAATQHVAAREADRRELSAALARGEVQAMLHSMGADPARVAAAAATIAGKDLEQAAATARQVNHELSGGTSTISISTNTVIIALLLIILLMVALK